MNAVPRIPEFAGMKIGDLDEVTKLVRRLRSADEALKILRGRIVNEDRCEVRIRQGDCDPQVVIPPSVAKEVVEVERARLVAKLAELGCAP
jgi:hypothetical protein